MKKSVKKIVVILDLILLIVLIVLVIKVHKQQDTSLSVPEDIVQSRSQVSEKELVYSKGHAYYTNTYITTVLIMGVDSEGKMTSNDSYENNAKCDFAALLMIDEKEDTYSLLHLNRDTMTEVSHIGIGGSAGSSVMQLALAYTYGDGMHNSSQNTVDAVEHLLYGIDIDHYFTINMSGLSLLIDAIGGVDVTIHGDFSKISTSFTENEMMHLNGENCITYLRARRNIGEETNIERTQRQQEFIYEILPQIKAREDLAFVITEIADYVVTDMNMPQLTNMSKDLFDADFSELITPEGTVSETGEFIEFYADDEKLRELVIRLLYTQAEETL